MPTREEVLKQALELSPEDQEILRIQLDENMLTTEEIDNEIFATPEFAAKWSAELDRRIEAMQRGEVIAEDADIVLERIKNRVDAMTQAKKAS